MSGDDYDAAANSVGSYYAAIAAIRKQKIMNGEILPYSKKEVFGDCILYCGDAAEILLIVGRVPVCLTDPPYGIGIALNPVKQRHEVKQWDNAPVSAELLDMIISVTDEQIIWGGNYFDLPPSRGFVIWDKVQPVNFSLAMCEFAWWSADNNAKLFRYNVTRNAKDDPPLHPTQKPVALMKFCINQLKDQGGAVLDPFMGSGTTGVACAQTGRAFVGIERDPKYFEIAVERIRRAYDQPDLFVPAPAAGKKDKGFI
jgi:DNA modification methylase